MKQNHTHQKGNMSLVIFAVIGITVAAAAFFITFITTQKASEPPKYKNLILSIPSDPPRPSFDALPTSTLIVIQASPSPISASSPSAEPIDETEPTL